MRFVLRKDYPDHSYGFAVVHPAVLNRPDPNGVTFEDDRSRATRFDNRDMAERWQATLNVAGYDGVTIIAVQD
jgi:hypothetical protein